MRKIIQQRAVRILKMRLALAAQERMLVAQLDGDLGHGEARALAERIGISVAYLSDVRKFKRGVGDKILRGLAEVPR